MALGSKAVVRITDADDGSTVDSALDSFLKENHLDWEEERSLRAGDRVTLGGGAAPLVHVEIVAVQIKGEWTDPYGGVFSKDDVASFDAAVSS